MPYTRSIFMRVSFDSVIERKIQSAQNLIRAIASQHNVALAFSGGKDSSVLYWLAESSGASFKPFHFVTTIDPPGTIKFCEKHGCDIVRPQVTFLELVRKKGLPTMFRRFCCKILKQKFYAPYTLIGVRKAESVRRSKCYSGIEDILYYSRDVFTNAFYPMIDWTDEDIYYCVDRYSIECHPLYYGEFHNFHVERRLGCIGCPLQGDRGRSDYKQYPKLAKLVLTQLVLFHLAKRRTEDDAALNFLYNLYYSNHGSYKYDAAVNGLFPIDPWVLIEREFGFTREQVLSSMEDYR